MDDICEECWLKLTPEEQQLCELSFLLEKISEKNIEEISSKINFIISTYPKARSQIRTLCCNFKQRIKDIPLITKLPIDTDIKRLLTNMRGKFIRMLGEDAIAIIEKDDVEGWIKFLVESQIDDKFEEAEELIKYAIICGSEKIIRSAQLNFNFRLYRYMCEIVQGGNLAIIRQSRRKGFGKNPISIALQSCRPHLAYWIAANLICPELPNFQKIADAFAVNVLCYLSHNSKMIYRKAIECKYGCFAKINLENTSFSFSYSKFLDLRSPECVRIAASHKYFYLEQSFLNALHEKNTEACFAFVDAGINVNGCFSGIPYAALARELDVGLFNYFIEKGANKNNIYIRAILGNMSLIEFRSISCNYIDPNFRYFYDRYTRNLDVKGLSFFEKRFRFHPFGIMAKFKMYYIGDRENLRPFVDSLQLAPYPSSPNEEERKVIFTSPEGLSKAFDAIKCMDMKAGCMMLVLVNHNGDQAVLGEAEKFARENDIKLLEMCDEISLQKLREIIQSESIYRP